MKGDKKRETQNAENSSPPAASDDRPRELSQAEELSLRSAARTHSAWAKRQLRQGDQRPKEGEDA